MKFLPLLASFSILGHVLALTVRPDSPLPSSHSSHLDSSTTSSDLATRQAPQNVNKPDQVTDWLVFRVPIDTFNEHHLAHNPPYLDWHTDGCTHVSDKPLWWNFQPSCYRHDFAYRNIKSQKRWNKHIRHRVDRNFLHDMMNECHTNKHHPHLCKVAAWVYYVAVRVFGRK